jgi:hypothetical protein
MEMLDTALKGMYGDGDVVRVDEERVSGEKRGVYRRYAVPSALVKIDYVEVFIDDELSVFYRSQGSATKYVWPIQQAVGDLDAQKKRMLTLLRDRLQWKLIAGGCGVLECYDF